MSDYLQEVRSQLDQEAEEKISTNRVKNKSEYLGQRLDAIEKRINEIPEGNPNYRYELNLLYKEKDIILDMIADLHGTRRPQYTDDMPDHEERLVARIETQQEERAAKKAEFIKKVDAFKDKLQNNNKRSVESFKNGVNNLIHIFGFQRRMQPTPEYEK